MAFGPGYGGDGGFWVLGADGKLHWVPPWNPEITKILDISTSLAAVASRITNADIRAKVVGMAENLALPAAAGIQAHVKSMTH
jgi:hypothetical protein